MKKSLDLLEILYDALNEPVGLLVQVENLALGRQQLYKARRDASDPALARLQFRQSPIEGGNLVIVKGPEP